MNKGILLMAYGDKAYLKYAYNMAFSIKYFSAIPICLLCENTEGVDASVFDRIITFDPEKRIDGHYDYAKNKINIDKYTPFDKTLYLDVDGVCLKNIDPIFDLLSGSEFYAQIVDAGGKKDKIDYSIWATNETIWHHFELDELATLPASQTSIIYFENNKVFDQARINYKKALSRDQYISQWGRSSSHPDELYFSVALAQLNIMPDRSVQPIFYPHVKVPTSEIFEKYYILSQYGGFGLSRPYSIDLYDRHLSSIMNKSGVSLAAKGAHLYRNKFHALK
jgi:hypothetical protein